jgi:hypothetical protein
LYWVYLLLNRNGATEATWGKAGYILAQQQKMEIASSVIDRESNFVTTYEA